MSIYGKYQPVLPKIMTQLTDRFTQLNQDYKDQRDISLFEHLNARIKGEQSMIEKCQRKGYPVNTYSALRKNRDSIGLRIVCNFIDDIYACINLIEQMPDLTVVQRKDYITNSKPNGYRSYHLILDKTFDYPDPDGQEPGHYFVEVQLRTIAMDTWASLEHEIKYKRHISNPEMISQELKRVADELASCDISMQTIRQLVREDQ